MEEPNPVAEEEDQIKEAYRWQVETDPRQRELQASVGGPHPKFQRATHSPDELQVCSGHTFTT